MAEQAGFFDTDERLRALSAAGDPLERLKAVVDFEVFRADLRPLMRRLARRSQDVRRCPRQAGLILAARISATTARVIGCPCPQSD
jgi:hypothetical protein